VPDQFSGLWIIPILAVLILVHEIGHFVTARMVGVKVEEFGIGIPPRIKGWTRNGVIWSINAIPFGGFVRVLGEDGRSMAPDSMNVKSPAQRAFFLAAGAGMNVLLALVLMFVVLGIQGLPTTNIYVALVEPGSPAAAAGWREGDRLVTVGGDAVKTLDGVAPVIAGAAGSSLAVVLQRNGERIETTVEPRRNPPSGQGPTGVRLADPTAARIAVESVIAGGAAELAGWRAGDKIVSVDGQPADDTFVVSYFLRNAQGESLPLVIERDGERIETNLEVPIAGFVLTEVSEGSSAGDAALEPGDRVVGVAGEPAVDALVVDTVLREASGETVLLTIERDGQRQEVELIIPQIGAGENALGAIGVNARFPLLLTAAGINPDLQPTYEPVPLAQVIPRGFQEAYENTRALIRGLGDLVTGQVPLDQVAGPIGMGQITSEALRASPLPVWVVLAQLSILLSLNLAVLNLLPLPALDGGRLAFVVVEVLRGGRKVDPQKEGLVHFAGLVILLGLMFVIAFVDIDRLRDGRSFLP
jgi:regulator of sigma E protease